MSLRNRLKRQLRNREFRHAYADEQLNLSIGTQIKVIREQQELSQTALAEMVGTKQAGISRAESANYDGWSIALLRRIALAFDLRLKVTFEEFGTLWNEVDEFGRESLQRRKFEHDPEFQPATALAQAAGVAQRLVPIDTIYGWRGAHGAVAEEATGGQRIPPAAITAATATAVEQGRA